MRVFVSFDSSGTITSIGAPAERLAGDMGLVPAEGHSVEVFDVPELRHHHQFERYLAEYVVETHSGTLALKKK